MGWSTLNWLRSLSFGQDIAILSVVIGLSLVLIEGYLVLQLLEQRGHLLLRIEALEAQLAGGGLRIIPRCCPCPTSGGPAA